MSARIRGSKTELEELGESIDDVMSTSKLQGLVKGMTGFDILESDGKTYKDIYEIILGIGEKWPELSDINKASLLEALSGKRNSNALAGLLGNLDNLKEAYETAEGSAGSAEREQAKYMSSLQYSLDQLTAHGEEFWNTFINKDDVKDFIDLINGLISKATVLVETFGSLPTTAAVLGGFASIKGTGIINKGSLDSLFGRKSIDIATPFANAEEVIWKYNQAIEHNSLTQDGWNRLLAQSDDGLKAYLTNIKGSTAYMSGYNISLQGNVTGLTGVSSVLKQYNALAGASKAEQQAFATAVGISNTKLGSYLAGLKGSTASLSGYGVSLVASTAKTVALTVATTALNAALTMGIGVIVTGLITAISAWINSSDKVAEKAEEVTSKFKEQKNELTKNRDSFNELATKYERLSKGVNDLGENLSLTNEEFDEYHDVVNRIAEMFPSWVKGWDAQGNAILNVKGNVEELTKAYNNATIAANGAILKEAKTVFKDFKNDVDDTSGLWSKGFSGKKFNMDGYEALKKVINSPDIETESLKNFPAGGGLNASVLKALEDTGLKKGTGETVDEFIARACKENPEIVRAIINDFEQELEEQMAGVKSVAEAYVDNALLGDYAGVDESLQSVIKQIVGNFDYDFYSEFDNLDELYDALKGLLNDFNNLSEEEAAGIKTFFEVQTKFNNNEIPVAEYQDKLNTFLSSISGLPEETQKAIKLVFGITTNEDGSTSSEVDTMVKNVQDKFKGKFNVEIGQLESEELKILNDLDIPPEGIEDWSEVETLIANVSKKIDETKVALADLEKASDNIKPLGSAFKELSDDGYITVKTLKEVKDAAGLSNEEWDKYEDKLLKAKSGSAEFNQIMSELTYKILDNAFANKDLNELTEEQIAATLRENGVINASAVAHDWLTRAKEAARIETELMAATTDSEVINLAVEAEQAGITGQAFYDLVLNIGIFNNTELDVSEKIAALQELGFFAELTADTIDRINSGGSVKRVQVDGRDFVAAYDADGKLLGMEEITTFEPNYKSSVTPQYSSDKSGSDKNKALDDYLKKAEAALKTHKDELKYIDELQYAYDNLAKTEEERADILDKMAKAREDYIQREMDVMDNLQSMYNVLKDALEEQEEHGALSVDTLQSLLELEPQYINMLIDENGNLELNQEAIDNCTAAYIDNLAAKSALNLIDSVSHLKTEQEQLELLKGKAGETGDALWDLVSAQLAVVTASVSPEVGAALTKQVEAIRNMAESAKAGIPLGGLSGFEDSEDADDKSEELAEAWKKEHLEQLKDGLNKQKDLIDRYKKNIEVLDFGLEIIETDDFTNRADLVSDKLDKLKSYGAAMRTEFDRVADIIPQTGDEAAELASRLEELGSEMRSNVSAIRETTIELQKLNIDIASALIDDRMGELQAQLDNIDKRIEILNSDYKDDYRYASGILSMDMLLPVYSDLDKKRREKEKSDKQLIKVEQETQDKINEIVTKSLEMQAKENAEARAKERENLIKDMKKARKDVQKKLDETHEDYLEFLDNNETATDKSIEGITDSFKNMSIKLPEVDISSVDTAANQVKTKLEGIFNDNVFTVNANAGTILGASSFMNSVGGGSGGSKGESKGSIIGKAVVPGYSYISSPYGYRIHPIYGTKKFHSGTDYAAPGGTPIYAYAGGTVALAGWNGGYGNCVIIDHGYGRKTLYGHASRLHVVAGQTVRTGERIADVGTTGQSTGNHLHFEYRVNDSSANPSALLPFYAEGTIGADKINKNLGIAGENYKPEILVDKATGKTSYIDSPTVIDTTKTDVIGEKQTAKLPKFAGGTIIKIPEEYGDLYTYMGWQMITSKSSNQYKLRESAGMNFDAEGYGKINGRYVIATTTKMGNVGDFVDVELADGTVLNAIIGDIKNSKESGVNEYGHNNGRSVVEFVVDKSSWYGKKDNPKMSKTTQITNLGENYFTNPDYKGTAKDIIDSAITLGWAVESVVDSAETLDSSLNDIANSVEATGESLDSETPVERKVKEVENFYNDAVDAIGNIEKDIILDVQDVLNDSTLSDFDKSRKLYDIKYDAGIEASAVGKEIYDNLVASYEAWLQEVKDDSTKWSVEVYNAYRDAFSNISDLTYNMANSAVEAKQAEADSRWKLSENWIADRNTYNDWDAFDDSEVDAWERVIGWLRDEYPNELEKIKQAEQNLFNAEKESREKSISDIEDYINARNAYNDWDAYGDSELKAIRRITKEIDKEYKDRLITREEYIDKLEEQSQRIYSLAQDETNEYLSNFDKYIEARNHFNDWDDFGDSEIKAIKRQCEVLDEAYRLNLMSLEEYTEKSAEYTQKLYSVAKESITEKISELVEDYEEIKQLESSQLESQKTLLQSYYDVTNAIVETQHEIDKELRASMAMYEYLNEETRKQLFNQEDYNLLSQELLDIQSAANELQKKYQEDILNADAETIAEITEQYQMQYDTMMKQYDIARAELEVAKKRQNLDNVLAERNTRMFINGQWQWVAKTQDVINAQNELADAEINKKKQEASLEQTEAINSFTAQINSLETNLNKTRKWWEDMQEMLSGESDEVAKALKEISEVSSPEFKRIIEASGEDVDSFSILLSESTTTLSTIINGDSGLTTMSIDIGYIITDLRNYSKAIQELTTSIGGAKTDKSKSWSSGASSIISTAEIKEQMKKNSDAWWNASTQAEKDALHDENVRLGNLIGLDDDDYNSITGKWNYHAAGTRYTPGGFTALGEDDFEAYITNGGRLIPINQPTIGNIGAGGIVFNREQMANLRNLWDLSNLSKISPFVSSSNANSQNTVIDNSIHINGLTVGEQGNEDWINGLRRYVATHK